MLSVSPAVTPLRCITGPMLSAPTLTDTASQLGLAFDEGLYRSTENLANRRRGHDRCQKFVARIALDASTRADAFRLRHLCYASKGYIDARPDGRFSDEYDEPAENATVVVYDEGQPVGSVRVCGAAPKDRPREGRKLPVAHVFPAEMERLLGKRGRAVEINRLVCDPAHDHNQGLVFTLMRMADYVIRRQEPDFVTSCVRSNHVPFYKRLKFEEKAGPKLYTGLKFMTTLMAARRETFDTVRSRLPMLQITPASAARYGRLWAGDPVTVFEGAA